MTFKQKILNLFFPLGTIQRIRTGYLKGFKIRLSKNSLWSPVFGRWEPDSQRLFTQLVRKGNVVYDLGANNGLHSLLFAKLTGEQGIVFAFEPLKSNCEEINENAALNNIKNIEIVNVAVSNSNGETVFHLGEHDKQGSLVGIGSETGKDIQVKTITLDSFISSGKPSPDFIKIDIEGAEGSALHGFVNHINEKKPHIFIELHTPEQDRVVGDFLMHHQYVAYRLTDGSTENELNIQGLKKIKDLSKTHPHPDGIWGNILAVHPLHLQDYRVIK
jgi:FkbM family methyltransferase